MTIELIVVRDIRKEIPGATLSSLHFRFSTKPVSMRKDARAINTEDEQKKACCVLCGV